MQRSTFVIMASLALCVSFLAGRFAPGGGIAAAAPQPPVVQDGEEVAGAAPQGPSAGSAVGAVYSRTIAGSAFQPTDSDLAYTNLGASIYPTTAVGGFGVRTWLELPNGATLTNVTFYFVDNVAAAGLSFTIQRYDPAAGTTPGTIDSGGTASLSDSTAVQSLSFDLSEVIDTSQNAYALRASFDQASSSLRLHGARITYSVPSVAFLPAVSK